VQIFCALNANHLVPRRAKLREHDPGTIGFDNLPHLIHPGELNAVDLVARDLDVLDESPNAHDALVQFELGLLDGLGSLASDKHLRDVARMRLVGAVTIRVRERRRKVDCSASCRLNELYIFPVATTYELLHREINVGGVDNTLQLRTMLAERETQ